MGERRVRGKKGSGERFSEKRVNRGRAGETM